MLSKIPISKDPDMAKFYWEPSPLEEHVTSYYLEKTIDVGLNWDPIITINNVNNSPNYDPINNRFFYIDDTPVDGQIIRIRPYDGINYGPWGYVFCTPKNAKLCTLFIAVIDSLSGQPLENSQITVGVYSSPELENDNIPSIVDKDSTFTVKQSRILNTNNQGIAQIDLIQKSICEVTIVELGKSLRFMVPEIDVLNFSDADKYAIYEAEHHPNRR